ncbi:MAG: hypothetical protein AMJ69_02050 [Gammaproteobacteria bacterium SG8_47]|nr:MAG: hypothetical protein AMJ69_02050 [Gammaproteobacteria bacterium SG8_47]
MIPIHELLQRIRWDRAFAQADFVLGFYDRVEDRIVTVPFEGVSFPPGDHFAFECVDEEGTLHRVPYHRVRVVYRDGVVIWQRDRQSAAATQG